MTSRGGGKDRFKRDYSGRSEESGSNRYEGRMNAPPSRHLWVGNLSHGVSESDLAHNFLRFGEIESLAFQPGRSYAFINFCKEEEAVAALRSLQGFQISGLPLRIEFAKAEKSSAPARGENFLQHRDDLPGQRESGLHNSSPDTTFSERSRMSDKTAEPSEVLWIGFPALLKVDEMILRKAFSPFGEIEKITTFPGRTYAFVRFRSLMAACRAKETLQGKLFGNPRVHICFAKSESGSSSSKSSVSVSSFPHFKSEWGEEFPEDDHQDRNFGSLLGDPSIRSPNFMSNLESRDPDAVGISRKSSFWAGGGNVFEQRRLPELGSEIEASQSFYELGGSPVIDRGSHFRNFSPRTLSGKNPLFEEDSYDLPEESFPYHGAKRLKTGPFISENELPEYNLSGSARDKRVVPHTLPDFALPLALDRSSDPGSYGIRQISDLPHNFKQPQGESNDKWKMLHDGFHEYKRFTPEPHQSSLQEWKWEGTIAKGGTPVCRARCFPVGKVLDMILPEILDCTARTGLDMLAKHYYQASNAWVVFFVPETDTDIGFYNEFMHYLEDKERAAVAKLNDKNTLFLVPPSDFAQNVLKVPGKLSFSGVILRLEHPGSNFGSLQENHNKDANFLHTHGDTAVGRQISRAESSPSGPRFSNYGKLGDSYASFSGNMSTSVPPASFLTSHVFGTPSDHIREIKRDYSLHQQDLASESTWSHQSQSSVSRNRYISQSSYDHNSQQPSSILPKYATNDSSIPISGGISKASAPLSMASANLQPEQLAKLASSLFGLRKQQENTSLLANSGVFRQAGTHDSEVSVRPSPQGSSHDNVVSSGLAFRSSETQQVQQQLQEHHQQRTGQFDVQRGNLGNLNIQNGGPQEEGEADPQKRLQATLQLAAALLQQIQQGKPS